jgi:hypothetical protein
MKIKFAVLLLLLTPLLARAQGLGYLRKEVSPDGGGVTPYPLVTVCTSGADLKTLPCIPKVSIYTDDSLVTQKANPFRGGADGSIEFHVAPGTYIVSITAPYSPGYSFKIVLTTGAGGGLVTEVTASGGIVSSGGTIPDITCPTCVLGPVADTQIPVGTGTAQTVSSSPNLTFLSGFGDSFLNVGGSNNFLHTNPSLNLTALGATASSTDGQVDLLLGSIHMLLLNMTASVPTFNMLGGSTSLGGRTIGLGTDCTKGTTSGLFCSGVAAAAGIPNPIIWPLTTGGANQVLKTDGGNPQQTSWADQSSGTNFGTPPTTPNIFYAACDQPSGGVAALGFCKFGQGGRDVATNSGSIVATDRMRFFHSTFSGAVAVAVPQAGSTTDFDSNFGFAVKTDSGATDTLTPATSQISGNDGVLQATLVVPPSSTAYCYSFDNANYQCTVVGGTKYTTWQECNGQGLGDGLNAIPAGTYLEFACWNDTGATVTIARISCWTNNNGTSTMQVANNAGTNLLTGAVTCTNVKSTGGAAGTQSATVTLPNGDAANFTFVSDGATLRTSWFIKGTF